MGISLFVACKSSSQVTVKSDISVNKIKQKKLTQISKRDILEAINDVRKKRIDCNDGNGMIGPSMLLMWNDNLYSAALEHSIDLATTDTFSHLGSGKATDRTGLKLKRESYFDERIEMNGYKNASSVGENIAAGQTSIDEVVDAWLASPDHCANLVNPVFKEVGVAIAFDETSEYGIYWTQNLGDRY